MGNGVTRLLGKVRPLLSTQPHDVQGEVLRELTVAWLLAHKRSNARASRRDREVMLNVLTKHVWNAVRHADEPAHGAKD